MSGRIPHTLSEAYRIGVESARVNVAPGLLLQAIALALVWAYYSIAPFESFLETLSMSPLLAGPGGAFVSRAFFGGILPGAIMVTFPALRPRFPLRTILAMTLYWGVMGVVVYGLYALQAWMFGEGNDLRVLLAKTAFDQFVETVTQALRFGAPLASAMETLAEDVRKEYRTHVSERIAKAPVRMLIPTGTLILPAMLLLVLGPVILNIFGEMM